MWAPAARTAATRPANASAGAARSGEASPTAAAAPRLHGSVHASGICSRPGQCGSRRGSLAGCRGFVGEGTRPAGEYHSADFAWEELWEEGQAAVARQRRELLQYLEQGQGLAAAGQADGAGQSGAKEGDSWERFHAQHGQARFFKEKRYLMLEFPSLSVADPPQHIAEIGCGCGSALLPILAANPACRVTGCDISPTALQLFRRAAQQAGVQQDRIHTFVLDASSSGSSGLEPAKAVQLAAPGGSAGGTGSSLQPRPGVAKGAASGSPLAGLYADSLLLVFTLSALPPEAHRAALSHACAALRPGGLLLFRDYGMFDLAQLRFPGAQMLGDNLYRRSEGTLAYFFSTEALRAAAAAAGFEEVACEYARVQMRNRKTGIALRRVFVHGVFRKPG